MNNSQGKGFMMSRSLRVLVRNFFLVFVFLGAARVSAADLDFSVYDIRKTLPLHSHEKTYRDFYVNIGSDNGVKAGSILAVYRRQSAVDVMHNIDHEDLIVPVAHMKVIQAGKTMSVARIESLVSKKQIPVVEFNTVMLGDRVELTQENDTSQDKTPKRKVASVSKK